MNRRVHDATTAEAGFVGEDPEQMLRQMLPTSVSLALDALDLAEWNPKALINSVAGEVEAFLPEQRQRTDRIRVSSLSAFVEDQPPPEEVEETSCAPYEPTRETFPTSHISAEKEFLAYHTAMEQLRDHRVKRLREQEEWHAAGLTAQQLEIMPLARQGLKQGEIARRLNTSTNNVKSQISQANRKIRQFRERQALTGT